MSDLVDRLNKPVAHERREGFYTVTTYAPDPLRAEAAYRISQQDAELERVSRELDEAKEFRAILEGHLAAAIDDYNEARKAAFIEAAEIAGKLLTADLKPQQPGFIRGVGYAAQFIFDELRAKAEGTELSERHEVMK